MAEVADRPDPVFSAELGYKTRTTKIIERFAENLEFPHCLELRLKRQLLIETNCSGRFKVFSLLVSNFHSGDFKGVMAISELSKGMRCVVNDFVRFISDELAGCAVKISGSSLTYIRFSNSYVLLAKSESELYEEQIGTCGQYAVIGAVIYKD